MGMSIEEAIGLLERGSQYNYYDSAEDFCKAYDMAIETMRKYQMMQADYEAKLKADMVAMLEKLKSEIILQVIDEPTENGTIAEMASFNSGIVGSYDIIQQKINALKEPSNDD